MGWPTTTPAARTTSVVATAPPTFSSIVPTEAAAATLRWGREALGLEEIIATIHPLNRASRRVLEKVGMLYRGSRLDAEGDEEHWFSSPSL